METFLYRLKIGVSAEPRKDREIDYQSLRGGKTILDEENLKSAEK
jgi:hypothetical protein